MHGVSGRASRSGSSNDDAAPARASAPGKQTRSAVGEGAAAHAAAEVGFSGQGGALPHQEAIQRSFGRHDVSNVTSFSDTLAQKANGAMGSEAFASGDRVAFAGSPDLHTAAHEAAHVVQQRKGAGLAGGVGRAGDGHEQAADAVADAVVRGDSAEQMLDASSGSGGGGGAAVQHKVPEGAPQETVTAHFHKLVALHELDADTVTGELASAIEICASAPDAMARLDQRLDPTATLKEMVRGGRYQAALEEVVRVYRPAAGVTYKVQATDDYASVLPQGTPIPPGIPFGVVSDGAHATNKEAVIYMHQHWIQRWILENQIGSLINTIEHESTHANQKNLSTTQFADNTDVMEFEAYTHEILLVNHKANQPAPSPMPTQAQLQKAYDAAKGHLAGLKSVLSASEQVKYDGIWAQVEQVFPELISFLDRRDERRGASKEEEQRFTDAARKHGLLGERLAKMEEAQESHYGQTFRDLESEETAAYREVLTAHQELHESAKARVAQAYAQVEAVNDEFSRYHRSGPRRTKAAKPAKKEVSGSSQGGLGLAPPPGFGGFGLLAPPTGFAQLAPPPTSAVPQPQQQQSDGFDDFGDFADFQSAAPASSTAHDDDFGDFEGFQSAPATSSTNQDDDFGDFGDFQSASAGNSTPQDESWAKFE